jgi:hypothetical protein
MPVVWGRYFTSAATSGLVEYRARRESQPLRDRNIRVLPIARQTKHVDGTQAQASAGAQLNVEDLIKTFGASYLHPRAEGSSCSLMLRGLRHCQLITTWDGLGRLLIIAAPKLFAWHGDDRSGGVRYAGGRCDLAGGCGGRSARGANPRCLGCPLACTRLW